MKKSEADEMYSHMMVADMDGGSEAAKLSLYTAMRKRHAGRWDIFTFNWWIAYDYLKCFHNPQMIPMAFPWLKLAVSCLIHGPSERIK